MEETKQEQVVEEIKMASKKHKSKETVEVAEVSNKETVVNTTTSVEKNNSVNVNSLYKVGDTVTFKHKHGDFKFEVKAVTTMPVYQLESLNGQRVEYNVSETFLEKVVL